MATDYRYDQFNDVLETVERVELHIVPSVSPFVIHLDEVPLRGDPSTVIVREVTGTVEGARQYGRTFTEVAETPAQDAFRLDYNTGADNDANWNTGAMLFNAADASVMVEVTYQATGTLASLKTNHYPSWWTDRGDGSDGDFYSTEDTTIEGVKNYASVMIPEGVTVSVSPAVLIKCQGAFVNMGTVTADGQGAAGAPRDRVPEGGDHSNPPALGIAGADGTVSLGGAGGATAVGEGGGVGGSPKVGDKTVAVQIYRTALLHDGNIFNAFGSGGGSGAGTSAKRETGAGGAGGGGIFVAAGEVYNAGTITANGLKGEDLGITYNAGGGGGGGGAIIIVARRIANTGIVTANGGAAGVNTTNYKPGAAAAGGEGFVVMKEGDAL
jgi:hypothetical protein